MSPRVVKDAEVRRAELMNTALGLFAERGYEETSVQDITDAVGIAKGTFYHHFASKDDLLEQVAAAQAAQLLERATAFARETVGEPLREIATLIGMVTQWDLGEQSELSLAYLRVVYRTENLALHTRTLDASAAVLAPLLAEVLAEGNELGVCQVGDPETTAEIVLAMYRGLSDHLAEMLLASEGRPERVHVVVEHLQAIETAIERTLGIAPGALGLYDHDRVEQALCGLFACDGGAP